MPRILYILMLGLLISLTVACSSKNSEDQRILVFAAASLTNALNEVTTAFEEESGVEASVNYAGSQSLAQQIASGAPADLIISAGPSPIEFLIEKELLDSEPEAVLSNRLVVVTRQGMSEISLISQLGDDSVESVAIASPKLAPAGQYAQDSLTQLGLWADIQSKLITAPDVRATLAYVEAGNVDVAIVYSTDAATAGNVQVLDIVPPGSYLPIVYPAAAVKGSDNIATANEFIAFLKSEEARSIFRRHGFDSSSDVVSADNGNGIGLNASILVLTLQVAIVATGINLPIALALGWLMVKKRIRGQFILDILVSLPLAVPPVVIGFLLLVLLGRNGAIGNALHAGFGIDIVFTWIAAALASAIVSFPLMVRAVIVAMEGVDERLEMSARSLGAGPWRVFFSVTIPLAYQGILAGVLLGFVRALSEFGATIIVAGNIPGRTQTLPLAIFTTVQLGENDAAIRLVSVSIVLAILTLGIHNYLLRRSRLQGN